MSHESVGSKTLSLVIVCEIEGANALVAPLDARLQKFITRWDRMGGRPSNHVLIIGSDQWITPWSWDQN